MRLVWIAGCLVEIWGSVSMLLWLFGSRVDPNQGIIALLLIVVGIELTKKESVG